MSQLCRKWRLPASVSSYSLSLSLYLTLSLSLPASLSPSRASSGACFVNKKIALKAPLELKELPTCVGAEQVGRWGHVGVREARAWQHTRGVWNFINILLLSVAAAWDLRLFC